MSNEKKFNYSPLVDAVVEGIEDVKGQNITLIDLRKIENSVCAFFVICEGTSNTQVSAISDSIRKVAKEKLQERPWHVEGLENSEWVLMDYVDVVVHIFQKEKREYYDIESLWSDGDVTYITTG
ncbi:MAG: ribosome silencing factor [Schleiferiaceae bacterium]|nr:ribosome silencing factor [Schleiferiaceae bacterium]